MLFIVALTEHRILGPVLVPCMAVPHPPCLEVESILRPKDIDNQKYSLSVAEKEIVRLAGKYSQTNLLARFSRNGNPDEFFSAHNADFLKKQVIPYVEKQIVAIIRLMMGSTIPLYKKDSKYTRLYEEDLIQVPTTFASADFGFSRTGNGTEYRLRLWQGDQEIKVLNRNVQVMAQEPAIFLYGNQLNIFRDIGFKKINPFLTKEAISIPPEMEEKYYRNFVAGIVAEHPVKASGFLLNEINKPPVPVLSMENDLAGMPVFVLRFSYSGKEILWTERKQCFVSVDFSGNECRIDRLHREKSTEDASVRYLLGLGLEEKSGVFGIPNLRVLDERDALYYSVSWLSRYRSHLETTGFEIRQNALPKQYFTGTAEVKFDIKEKNDWFDVYGVVIFGDFRIPFLKLRKYILNDIREFELPDGSVAILPGEWFSRYKILYPFIKGEGFQMTFHRHHAHLLPVGTLPVNTAWLNGLYQDFEQLPQVALPEELKADLRSYQLTGYRWMYTLFRHNLGGCLADDMGLGKTVQAIAYLLKVRKLLKTIPAKKAAGTAQLSLFEDAETVSGQPASLVVMPTSLVHNWESELARFAPVLKVYRHTGPQRMAYWQGHDPAAHYDVILTTYGTVRNDVEFMKDTEFFSLILDESQQIKNPHSKTYKAVIELKAKHRLVLTGTPVENSLADLWSQMNFINRGLLGSYAFFRQNFLLPVENKQEESVTTKLQML
ncbi:MAG TPA: SNF2-related protein, partial [Prolixibacteraceae bacterium]|nr:SNF2-related protein [Prolixibacteraceae bacterium]